MIFYYECKKDPKSPSSDYYYIATLNRDRDSVMYLHKRGSSYSYSYSHWYTNNVYCSVESAKKHLKKFQKQLDIKEELFIVRGGNQLFGAKDSIQREYKIFKHLQS